MATVAVTGARTAIGRVVAMRLVDAGHEVVPFEPPWRRSALDAVDAVVHLHRAPAPAHDAAREAAADVEATRSLLDVVARSRVPVVVHGSSATVYGAHEDNPLPLTEAAPLRAEPDFGFAWHKRLADELVTGWAAAQGWCRVVVLRPATMLAPGHDDFVSRHLESPRLPLVRGHAPPMQALHPDDYAEAVLLAVDGDLRGPYNVAPDGWLSAEEVLRILGRKPLRLPEQVAFSLAGPLWRSHLAVAPAGGLRYLMHPWIVDASRLREAGWVPAFGNREVLGAFARLHRARLAIGPLRTTRAVAGGAGLGAAALAGLLARLLARRLRRA